LEQINQKSIINGSVYISAKLFDTHLRTYFDTYHIRFSSYEKKTSSYLIRKIGLLMILKQKQLIRTLPGTG